MDNFDPPFSQIPDFGANFFTQKSRLGVPRPLISGDQLFTSRKEPMRDSIFYTQKDFGDVVKYVGFSEFSDGEIADCLEFPHGG